MIAKRQKETAGDPPKRDRFSWAYTLWTAAVAVLIFYGNELDRVFNLYVFLIPILGIPALILLIALIVSVGTNAFAGRWRRMLSIAAAPVLVGSILFLMLRNGMNAEWVRFELGKPGYLREVSKLPAPENGSRFKVWGWGSTGGAAVANIDSFLVYDESDQVGLPLRSRSEDWKRTADQAAKSVNGFSATMHPESYTTDIDGYLKQIDVRRLDSHFYLVTQSF
jgi:hypothetical protein